MTSLHRESSPWHRLWGLCCISLVLALWLVSLSLALRVMSLALALPSVLDSITACEAVSPTMSVWFPDCFNGGHRRPAGRGSGGCPRTWSDKRRREILSEYSFLMGRMSW